MNAVMAKVQNKTVFLNKLIFKRKMISILNLVCFRGQSK